jgi:hypothetical protein
MSQQKNLEAKKENSNAVAAYEGTSWGAETSDTNDILIPKLLLMQGLSQAVADGNARMGEIIDSLTQEVLGSGLEKDPKPIKVIPLMSFKQWVVYEKLGDGKLQLSEIADFSPANALWEKEDEKYRRDLVLNFYVMLDEQIQDPTALPYLVSFRRTGYKTGMKLATHFKKCELAASRGKPVPPAKTTFLLKANKQQNDYGTFYVFDIVPSGTTSDDALAIAYEWYSILKNKNVRIDNRDLETEVKQATTVSSDEQAEF